MRRNLTVAVAAVAAAAALAALPASPHATAHAAAYPYFVCDQVRYNGVGVTATGCKPEPTGNYSRLTIMEWGSPTHFLCDNGRTTGDGMLITDKCSVF